MSNDVITELTVPSEMEAQKKVPYYKRHREVVMNALGEMDIVLKNNIITQPCLPKTTIADAVSSVGAYLSKNQLPPIPHRIVTDIIKQWVNDESKKEYQEMVKRVQYDPSAPDRWDDLMSVTFQRNDDCDRWALQHQVWLMKRRILGMNVNEKDQPILLNIVGEPGQGKTMFLNSYLLTPLPENRRYTAGDMSLYMDERHYDVFGDTYAVIFTETGKGEKVNVEMLKMLIDVGVLGRRDLGHNSFSKFHNNATLFGTSNRPLRELLKEESPRKWYEITFPTRTREEITNYGKAQQEISVYDLWRCIDENQPSELIRNWDKVHGRILATCAYVPMVEKWLLQYVSDMGQKLIGQGVPLWRKYQDEIANTRKAEYATTPDKFKAKAEQLGFQYKRTKAANVYVLTSEGYDRICKRYQEVFQTPMPVDTVQSLEGVKAQFFCTEESQ